jgi:hypothetical protein
MKPRRFLFEVPATILIGVAADTETEAWLIIKQLGEQSFAADHDALHPFLPGTAVDRHVTIGSDLTQADLLGEFQAPFDSSDMQEGDRQP